jgi:hypothetical protein
MSPALMPAHISLAVHSILEQNVDHTVDIQSRFHLQYITTLVAFVSRLWTTLPTYGVDWSRFHLHLTQHSLSRLWPTPCILQ